MSEESGQPPFKDVIQVNHDPIVLQELVDAVASDGAGATATFIGTTRDNYKGKRVLKLEYEGYVPMAKKELLKICQQAREKWDLIHIAITHRLGVCDVGQASVIIAVSSEHRAESIEAVHFIIDTLKASVPIWKSEVYEGDERLWKENAEWKEGVQKRRMVAVESAAAEVQDTKRQKA
jgi:molybdopterin synthase catalytic subunit